MVAQVVGEPVGVEAQLIGVADEVAGPQLVLVLEQESCISQNLPCRSAASEASAASCAWEWTSFSGR